jgi:mono/diheme cytochrome c family protein
MNKKILFFFVSLSAVMLIAACGGASSDGEAKEPQVASADEQNDEHMDDHDAMHIHADPPDEFAALTNPEAEHEEAIAAGQELFTIHCVTCHGPEGRGDGEGGVNLDPKPANLADGAMMGGLSDGYLFWRISKGGAFEPFNSAMPAWEQAFTEEQRWQLVSYLRTLSADDQHEDEMDHEGEAEHLEEDNHREAEDQHEGEEQHMDEEHMEGDEHSE